jgi:PAS domain S-box-containing protein
MHNETISEAQVSRAEARDRYTDLFEFAHVGYLTLSEQGQIVAINFAAAEQLGVERTTLIGNSFANYVAAEDVERWHLHLASTLNQDEKQQCELSLAPKDGCVCYIRADSRRLIKDGQAPTVQMVITDITKLKQTELELQQAQQLARIGSWYWNVETGEQVMSREMSRIFGHECFPPFPESRGVLFPVESWERLNAAVEETMRSGIGYDLELPAIHADGTPLWINTRSKAVRHANGEITGLRGTLQDITQRKRTEEQLRFQATLLNTVGQAIIATDLEGNVTYMNAAAESTYGWPAAIAVGRSILEITTPEVSQTQGIEIMGQLTQGQPWSGEFAVQHRSGKIFVAEVHDTPILDEAGKLIGIIGISSDISLRKQSEQSLAQSEERYRTLFKSIDEGFCLIEMIYDEHENPVDWRFLEVNPAFERQNGLFDAAGKRIRELAPNLEPHWFNIYGEVARTGEPIRFQNEAKALGERWFDLYAFRIGEPGSYKVAVLFKDITENKKVQDTSQATSQYARSLIEASLDPLVTISAAGKITDVNEASVNATGVLREQLIGTDFCDYFTNPEQARIGYRQVFSEGFVRDYPLAIRHTSGQIIDVLYNASVYKDDEGNVLGVFAAARDVTERNRLDRVLQDKNIELQSATIVAEAANLAKSNFLSSMSHEIRTPLNAVLGFAQLIEIGSPPPTPSQTQSLNQILKGGWYLLELINEILDLAQIESGKASLSREAVSLAEVLLECQDMIAPQATQRGIEMNFPSLATAWFVHADRMRVKQVLLNLLSNAIKYNKLGGKVVVTTEHIPGPTAVLRINVSDSGEGLTPEQLAQLFQPFNRLGKEGGQEEGSGIGLVVTKRLVELMGGRIGVESVAETGSTFWVELALTGAPQLAMAEIELTTLPRPNVAPETMERTVLYVEDNPANLALVEQLVASRPDLRLLSAVNGYSGVELARAYLPQVILMDINLPGMSGLDAMRILRADPATAHIPIIAISANAMPREIKSCLDAGFFDYLTKPIKVNLFLGTLDMALDFAKMGAVSGTGKSEG